MTQISSKLSVAGTDDPIVTTAQVPRLAGAFLFLGRTEFDAAIAAERTRIVNNSIGIYANGQPIRVVGEQPVYRKWSLATGGSAAANAAASNANTAVIRPGLEVALAADTNAVLVGSGASGGNNGDIFVDFAANTISTKSAGVWSVTTAAIYSGSGGSTTIANNLTTNSTTQALSAAQGVVLKAADDALTTAVAGKQATLVSATNIKTINGTTLLGAGDIAISGGTTIANNLTTTVAGSALDATQGKALKDTADALATTVAGKQATLVSGTSIKTVGGVSLLGSGNIPSGTPGGATTQVQYNNSGAFAGDAGLTYDSVTVTLGIKNILGPVSGSMSIKSADAGSGTVANSVEIASSNSPVSTRNSGNVRVITGNVPAGGQSGSITLSPGSVGGVFGSSLVLNTSTVQLADSNNANISLVSSDVTIQGGQHAVGGVVSIIAGSNTDFTAGRPITIATDSGTQLEIAEITPGTPKIGFFGATPAARPATGGASAGFVDSSGSAVNSASTFDGYTLQQVVRALRDLGILT